MPSIETLPFGKTGHESSRIIFGAAALAMMKQERADKTIAMLREAGVNHFDVAASYGDAELRLAPWLRDHRGEIFLATKTGDRTRAAAAESIDRSLERMGVEQIDLIQLHNLTDDEGWEAAMGPGGALEALEEARDAGKVRFLGVTGHGTRVARMHLRSLERFPFDSVLLPYTYMMMQNADYAVEFDQLLSLCAECGVAVQTIKSIARRRWRDEDQSKRFSWYEPIREPEALEKAIHWALSREGVFVNSSSDGTLLQATLDAAARFDASVSNAGSDPLDTAMAAHQSALDLEPLFVPGMDGVAM
ncbi:MAG: aldo/keto reductase [Myxococcota bacterium]|jgi:aryl-alcohol dehydrogenase-like predicted oxidoreductase|nr:aldo/keto reductase [Myxococcota bacterium]